MQCGYDGTLLAELLGMLKVRLTVGLLAMAACGTSDNTQGDPDASVGLDAQVTCNWVLNNAPVLPQLPTALDGIPGDPIVIRDGDQYVMFYGAVRGDFSDQETVRIFRATSVDGVTWQRPSTAVLVPGAAGQWDAAAIETPSVVKGPDGIYRLYYAGTFTTQLEDNYQIGLATSSDGITWTKHAQNPVVRLGASGSFDDFSIVDSAVHYDARSGEYQLWYSAISSQLRISIGRAVSSDGIAWQKQGVALELDIERQRPTDYGIMGPSVAFDGTRYEMVYSFLADLGNDRAGSPSIWHATSEDGLTWRKSPTPIIVNGALPWAATEVAAPTLLLEDGRARVWFSGTHTDYTSFYETGIGLGERRCM